MTTIYKICEASQWTQAEHDGEFRGSEVDLADGYIHFSTAAQVAGTAAKHFAGMSSLVLVAVGAEELGAALKWERSRGGDVFPHLYGVLPLTAMLEMVSGPFPLLVSVMTCGLLVVPIC